MAAFAFLAFSGLAMAKQDIPQVDGTYDVPGKPDLKVRVFVHKPKALRIPTSNPILACGLGDSDSSASVADTGWKLPSTWSYTLNPSSVPSSVGSAKLTTIASAAFQKWTNAIGGKVNISKTTQNTTINRAKYDGKNIIAWGRTNSSALAVTYTWYYNSGLVAEVDTIMNQKFPWSWTPYSSSLCADSNTYDAQNILTHELGHWYGLDDHYTGDYTENTMYGYGDKKEIKKDTLTTGDISGVNKIY